MRLAGFRVRRSGLILAAALVAGISYVAANLTPLPPVALVAWKGAGVGLLAFYAALNARALDGDRKSVV